MNRIRKIFFVLIIAVGLYSGIRYVGSVIHYNCAFVAEDCPPPFNAVGQIGWYLTGGSLIPLWNHDTTAVRKVSWNIENVNPDTNEQRIAADVTFMDGTTREYDLGTAHGCTGKTKEAIEDRKLMFGKVDCYYALSGTTCSAFNQKGVFRIERYDQSAKDCSIRATP